MIELEVNGSRHAVEPRNGDELRDLVTSELPAGHVIRRIDANGSEVDQSRIDQLEVSRLREVVVQTCTAGEIARQSLGETTEWIGRICGVLESISSDYRLGREQEGTQRLVEVVDALHVLVGLLKGINGFIEVKTADRERFERSWSEAETDLQGSIEGLFAELEQGDPVALADRTGDSLPRSLRRFVEVLKEL